MSAVGPTGRARAGTLIPRSTRTLWLSTRQTTTIRLQANSPALALGIQELDFRPTISTQPQSQTLNAGQGFTLTTLAANVAPRYQWYFEPCRLQQFQRDIRRNVSQVIAWIPPGIKCRKLLLRGDQCHKFGSDQHCDGYR